MGDDMEKIKEQGATAGLVKFYEDLMASLMPAMEMELGAVNVIMPVFSALDTVRREAKTKQEREEAEALLGGYDGDELMEVNIAMYNLAQKLPKEVWAQYKDKLHKLTSDIALNVAGKASNL